MHRLSPQQSLLDRLSVLREIKFIHLLLRRRRIWYQRSYRYGEAHALHPRTLEHTRLAVLEDPLLDAGADVPLLD